jgi:uncharacterized membrane protein
MTRAEFLTRLKRGLAGLPAAQIADIVADYEAHFNDAQEAGRSETEVAAALGEPERLAREQRAEQGVKRWQETKNPSAAASAVFAILGLGAIDILFLLPLLMGVLGTLLAFFIAAIGLFVAGAFVTTVGPFAGPPGGPAVAFLLGIGFMALAAALAAVSTLLTIGLVNGLIWYGRLHYRLLKPAIETQV